MTRGRHANHAYVAIDQPDDNHDQAHPSENPYATARSVLYGVLQHAGAELSAHETITAEHERWGSIAQLAAEYETIAQAAQHDRWANLLHRSGLTEQQVDDVFGSDAYGALSAELRRAEANHYNTDVLLPKLVQARSLDDVDDLASVIHHRVERATSRPAGSGRTRRAPRLIAGLIPEANGPMSTEMRRSLDERRDLIEQRAEACLDSALTSSDEWIAALGGQPKEVRTAAAWRQQAMIVAAYRDRYRITGRAPLGPAPQMISQKIEAARARQAVEAARALTGKDAAHRTSPTQTVDPLRL